MSSMWLVTWYDSHRGDEYHAITATRQDAEEKVAEWLVDAVLESSAEHETCHALIHCITAQKWQEAKTLVGEATEVWVSYEELHVCDVITDPKTIDAVARLKEAIS